MLTIRNYIRPQTLEEAYELCQKRSNVILGGMLWLKMQDRFVNNAIDLCDLGLDYIEEEENQYRIGAMTCLRKLETNEALNELTCGAMKEALRHIVGVQFRNSATIGGSIYGRFGFSDVLTLFEVLDAKVHLYKAGIMPIEEFVNYPRRTRDILTEIIIPKKEMKVSYISQRNTATDFPVLACGVSLIDGEYHCAIGARPAKAVLFKDENNVLKDGISKESAKAFGKDIAERVNFGSNVRAGEEYRKKICPVLVKRALMALKEA